MILRSGCEVYRHPLARAALPDLDLPLPRGTGLPLGSWFSQWSGNFYLDGLDQFAKRQLKVPGYLRYMDDFVLFSDSRNFLVEARAAAAEWLESERGLDLNPRHLEIQPGKHPAVFLGYRISRSGVTPSRRLRRRMGGRLHSATLAGPQALERCLKSYRGIVVF